MILIRFVTKHRISCQQPPRLVILTLIYVFRGSPFLSFLFMLKDKTYKVKQMSTLRYFLTYEVLDIILMKLFQNEKFSFCFPHSQPQIKLANPIPQVLHLNELKSQIAT